MSDWAARIAKARAAFPELVDDENWAEALQDVDLLGQALRDTIRVGYGPARLGPRRTPDVAAGTARLRDILGEDISMLPFRGAFEALAGAESLRDLAPRVNISRGRLHRLKHGTDTPTREDLESIARAFDKSPLWFHEYRVMVVVAALAESIAASPERSSVLAGQLAHLIDR